jgi:hypothetical protein
MPTMVWSSPAPCTTTPASNALTGIADCAMVVSAPRTRPNSCGGVLLSDGRKDRVDGAESGACGDRGHDGHTEWR